MSLDQDGSTHVVLDLNREALLSFSTMLGLQTRDAAASDFRVKFCADDYRVELIGFPKGKVIHPHRHRAQVPGQPRPLFKLLLSGRITYQHGQEVLLPMQLASVMEEVTYSGVVEEDSLLVLITPASSSVIADG